MIDFILGLYLASLAVRGWLRGLVREAMDLAGLVLGVVVAFRLSGPTGRFLEDRFGVAPELARLAAGIVLLILTGTALSIVAYRMTKLMRLPGLNLTNRLLGSLLALAWGTLIAMAAVAVVRALPLPAAATQAIDSSQVASRLTGPDSAPSKIFLALAGDDVLASLGRLRRSIGGERLVLEGDQRVEIEPASPDEIEISEVDARTVFAALNGERVDRGLEPLVWSEGLARVALGHAEEMYLDGYVSHVSPKTGTVADRVKAADIPLVAVGENLALASSATAAHLALMDSEGHRANILSEVYDRVGVAAVQGPLGLMVVEVFGG